MSNFISLHNQTVYSLLDSLCSVQGLFERAKELNQSAIAITDHGSLAAAWEALKASKKTGVKLLIGCESYFIDDVKNQENKLRHVIFIAKNVIGYKNLLTLNKLAFDQGKIGGNKVYPIVDWNLLKQYTEGLICLTACGNGIVAQQLSIGDIDNAEKTLLKLKELFGENLGIEILANNMKRNATVYTSEIDQKFLNRQLIALGTKHNIKIVATCNTHYLNKEEYDTHNVLLAIGAKQPIFSNFRLRYPVNDFYLKSEEEMITFFTRNYGVEKATEFVNNSKWFADLCEEPKWIDPKFSNPSGRELPTFPVKDQLDYNEFLNWKKLQFDNVFLSLPEDKQYLRYVIEKSFKEKIISDKIAEEMIPVYQARIERELDVFEELDISSYMLITADFLNYAKTNGITVGCGRGSAGGSYIAYLLNIHVADSVKYGLVFERFHNKLKKSLADIDNDIISSGRESVINYIKNKYGYDSVASISNLNTITPKVYVRDVSRALELGGSKEEAVKVGNDVAAIVPADVKSIDAAYAGIPLFVEYCKKYPQFLEHKQISNQIRNFSTHAGAIVIGGRPMTGLVPLRKDKDGSLVLEYEKDTTEDNGLVKIDILGLKTLDVIDLTFKLIKDNGKEVPNINFEDNDEKTYELIGSGKCDFLFQFGGSAGTMDLCRKVKPKNIEDLAIITTLARPGCADVREDFIKTRNGKKQITYQHPKLENALKSTLGYALYDESLLMLAADTAGWDLAEADGLRKLTKLKGSKPKLVVELKEKFISGCVKNDINETEALFIWENVVEPFGKYSFNKSHAVLYSIISYQTAYLKAHYPIEFLLANLMFEIKSAAPTAKEDVEKIKNEIRSRKVKILPPDINTSQLAYKMIDDKTLLTGLDALKYVGDDAIKDIIEKRPFKSFQDFMGRVSSTLVRANTIQALTASGALDSFCVDGVRRKDLFLYCSDYRKRLTTWKKKNDLETKFDYQWDLTDQDWDLEQKYALEVFYLGEGFICKPFKAYGNFFSDNHYTMSHIKKMNNKQQLSPLKGIVVDFFAFKVKKETSKFYGQAMAKITIEDKNGDRYSITAFPDRWEMIGNRLKELSIKEFDVGLALSFSGVTNLYEDVMGVIINDLYDIHLPPAKPKDLKAKKISIRSKKEQKKSIDDILVSEVSEINFTEKVEDFLYEEGVLNIE